MNRLCASLLQGSILALAAACGMQCARDAQAQGASPPPGKALVVLYRADKQPVAARVPLIANADRIGNIGNGEFVNTVVNPGRTFLRAGDRVLTTLAIQTSANQSYYVLIEAVPGAVPVRVDMREMTEASARRALSQSRPAAAGAAVAAAAPRAAAVAPAPAPGPAPRAAVPAVAAAAAPAPRPAPAPQAAPPRQVQAAPPPPQPAARRTVREPPPPEDDEEESEAERRQWGIAVIAKAGTYKLAAPSQDISDSAGNAISSSFDKTSKSVFGFEAELRHRDGFAIGAEVFSFKNKVTAGPFNGTQQVLASTVNGKYYFGGDTGFFHPFIGAGVGFTAAKFGGDLQGKASGPALQGMLGLDLRFSNVGLYLEYKYLNSSPTDAGNQKIKVGGSGIFAGLSVAF